MGTLKTIRQSKMLAQRGRCYYCGLPMWDPALGVEPPTLCTTRSLQIYLRCTAEHLRPRSEGGANTVQNIVAACWFCNSRRHHRKQPLSPDAHRAHVRRQMAAGKWLAAKLPRRIHELKSEITSASPTPPR